MNSFETLEARLQSMGHGSAIENLARMALTKEHSKTIRIGCLRALAQYYPLPGGAQPTKEALSAFLEQLDQSDVSTLATKTKGI
jgi:hypothetical protein